MKKLLCLCLIFCLALMGRAQNDSRSVRFGIKAGVNFSHINFSKGSPPPETPIETIWDAGLTIGAFMIVPLTEGFYLQPEYLYTQRGGEAKDLGVKYNINYLSLPLLLRWEPTEDIFLLAGPQFDLVIDAEEESNGRTSDLIHDVEQRHLGAGFGIGYQLMDSLALSGRFMLGISHVGLREGTAIQEFKYETFLISASYTF